MRDNTTHNVIQQQPKFLWMLALSFTMTTVFSNWFNIWIINIGGFAVNAAIFLFPFTLLFSVLITEVYGFQHTRRILWCGFFFNLFFISLQYFITQMPNPDYPTNNILLDNLLTAKIALLFASAIICFLLQIFSSLIIAKMKVKANGAWLAIRFLLSVSVALCISSLILNTLMFNNETYLVSIIFCSWLTGNLVMIALLPVFIALAKKLKRLEKLDISDKKTHFSLFSFNVFYTSENNLLSTIDTHVN